MYAGNAYSSYTHGGYSGLSTANISYETNSKDPVLLRARVFVGNINPKVGRDEIIQLFRSYGTLLGVTVFKGYAFVQFSHGSEADLAVTALNGYNWLNSILDVKLAISGQQTQLPHPHAHPLPHPKPASHPSAAANNAKAMGKRNQNQFFQTPPTNTTASANKDQKRAKFDQMQQSGLGGVTQQMHDKNEVNKNYAARLNDTEFANIHQNDNTDTLICGGCRFVTPDLAEFVEHRKHPCKSSKADGEPDALICTNCNEQFPSGWTLLMHINSTHNNTLYKEVYLPKLGENGINNNNGEDGGAEQIKNESGDVSMEQLLEAK